MRCPNCQSETDLSSGYCVHCGMAASSRMCPRGHVMDPTWTECRVCNPAAQAGGGFVPGSKGRTVVESGGAMPSGVPAGGFLRGAALLDGSSRGGAGSPKGSTVVEGGGASKGRTLVEPGFGQSKARTVFDPGTGSGPVTALPRLVGWLVTYSNESSGEDYRLREGRNIIGSEGAECDIVIPNDASVSSKHAVIIFRDGLFQIRDNDSTNGTYVNGTDTFGQGAVAIKNLDKVRLGNTELVLYAINF